MPRLILKRYLILILFLSACYPLPSSLAVTKTPDMRTFNGNELSGRVVDDMGRPVEWANIKADSIVVLTDNDGWFHAPSDGNTEWVTVYKLGFISRTRAASPGNPVLIRISPDDGKTIVLKFTGDVMFGGRFFDMNNDGNPEDGILPINPSMGDHMRALEAIRPLLMDSDITAINLESVLGTQPYFSSKDSRPAAFHPTKNDVYATHPNAVAALMKDGVNVIGLGNDHVYDMLDPGMANTIGFLKKLGLPYFGAGMNEAEAWTPAVVTVKGQRIAFIGCTTIFASGAAAKPNEITFVASDVEKKGGAAHCEKNRLSEAVAEAKKTSDQVVVMIHGRTEYDRKIPADLVGLSEIAKQAGALIVVNHHPDVVSGFSWDDGKISGWSLGNFISDQTVWHSFQSYLFTVYIRNGKISRAFIEPVLLQDNIARGITGDLADYIARNAAGLETGPFIIESNTMEVDVNQTSKQVSKSFDLSGGSGTLIQIPDGQWLSGFKGSGKLLLGRDLLWVGGFENNIVGETPDILPLWIQTNSRSLKVGPEFAFTGKAGIQLLRSSANTQDAVSTNLHRIPVKPETHITISGMYRGSTGAEPSIQVSFYPDTLGSSNNQIIKKLDITELGTWQNFQFDVQMPSITAALQVFLRLSPPVAGTATVDFDNIRVIEWAPENSALSALYNFVYLIGAGELTFSQSVLPGGDNWLTVSKTDISNLIVKQTP